MRDNGFMKTIFSTLPPETELAVELQCREIMACEDTDKLKAFCVELMKTHAKSEVVLSNAMMRLVELEAKLAVIQTPVIRNKGLYKLRLWIEQFKLARQIGKHRRKSKR